MNDTQHIERDLEETRERLGATIDALQQKLSPGQVLDQGLDWLKTNGGAEFSNNLMRSVRDNPMPVALVGLGVAWLMMTGSGGNRVRGYDYRDYRDRDWRGRSPDELFEAREPRWAGSYAGPGTYAGTGSGTYTGAGSYAGGYVGNGNAHAHERSRMADMVERARAAGEGVSRRADETVEAFEERMYEAKAGVFGIVRSVGETLAAFKHRVDDAMSAAVSAASAAANAAASVASGAAHAVGATASAASSGYHHASDMAAAGYGRASDAAATGYNRVSGAAATGYQYASSAASAVGEGIASGSRAAAHGVYQGAQTMYQGAQSMGAGVGYASRRAARMGRSSWSYLQDQPLLLAALGVSVGAALAMLVPASRYEEEVLGRRVGEPLRDTVRGMADDVAERTRRVAGEMAEAAQDTAEREGLRPVESAGNLVDEVRDRVGETAASVRRTAEAALEAGKDATRRELKGSESGDSTGSGSGSQAGAGSSAAPRGTTTGSASGTHGVPS